MCKKLMFLISLVLLVLASSVSATEFTWEGESPYSPLWVDPMNWDPLEPYGPDDCGDMAKIGSTGANPTVVITAITVNEVRGPAYEATADHEILLVQDANLFVCDEWSVRDTEGFTAYITLVDRARVYVDGKFNSNGDHQRTVMNLSDNSEFIITDDFKIGDEDDEYFELNMTGNAYLRAEDEWKHDYGEVHISLSGDAVLESHHMRWRLRCDNVAPNTYIHTLDITENSQFIVYNGNFRFCGGENSLVINLTDDALLDIDGEFRGGEDNDFDEPATYTLNMPCGDTPTLNIGDDLNLLDDDGGDGFAQINLHGGTINAEGELKAETDNWNIDICCEGVLILGGDVVPDILEYYESGNITICGFGPCGGPGTLGVVYDPCENKTTVWADVNADDPYDPDPPCICCGPDAPKYQPDQCLSWVSGESAEQHFVFLSTNYDKVANAPTDLSALVAILQAEETTYCPEPLILGACYYWRIVESWDCGTAIGQIWHFRVVDCMIVEDMESYDESCTENAVWEVWKDGAGDCGGIGGDGTGSSLYLATDPVHGGSQSMEYHYDSTGSERECFYSAATKTYNPPLNLVNNFEKALILYFYGDEDNDTESMWVVLSDGTNSDQSTYGVYGDPASDIQVEDWQVWAVDIADQFPSVDMSNVVSVEIGFGPRGLCEGVEDPGLPTGTVFFDDIQLCTTICVTKYAPDGDTNDDCVVDWEDVESISDDWLDEDRL